MVKVKRCWNYRIPLLTVNCALKGVLAVLKTNTLKGVLAVLLTAYSLTDNYFDICCYICYTLIKF